MKKLHLFFFIFLYLKGFTQPVAPEVIASGGGFTNNSQFSNSFTIGEISLVDTYTSGSFILTQGFQQPDIEPKTADDFFIPNGITPNGDGVNDVWEIPHLKDYPNCTVKVFNRWGQQLYSSVGYNQPWDGTFLGNGLPTADYYYVIGLEKDAKKNYTGTITVKR
jgi:gliding motility-associated-like protein